MIIYLIIKLIKDRDLKVLKISLILLLLILSVNISFNIFYNMNPIYKEFLEFHDVRTYLHDYNWMSYNNNKEVFDSVNWSQNDRDIFYAYCFGDEEIFNTDALNVLKNKAIEKIENNNILLKCINTFCGFIDSVEDEMYKFIFVLTVLSVILNNIVIVLNKNEKNEDNIKICFVNLILISVIAIHCLFIFLSRPMFRVVISIYIMGIALILYCFIQNAKNLDKKIVKYIFVLILLIVSAFEFKKTTYYAKFYNKENYSVYKEIIDYTSSHKENAYLYTLVMHDRFLAYSVYEKIENNAFSNIRPLGDWDTYTKNYYDFKERYNIDNIIRSLYEKDNVYLISGNVIWGEWYKEYIYIIEKYIEEHYDINIEYKIIKEFRNNIKIYKIEKR